MKRSVLAVIVGAAAAASSAHAGLARYDVELSQPTASLGDAVIVTIRLDLDPQGTPFSGLSVAAFDAMVGDPAGATGLIDNISPGMGLAPSWLALGNPGAVSGDDILGIEAGQFPPTNFDLNVLLYTFEYQVTDDSARTILFDVAPTQDVVVYGASIFNPVNYVTTTASAELQVVALPTPGALALLGAAGVIGRRRRRR